MKKFLLPLIACSVFTIPSQAAPVRPTAKAPAKVPAKAPTKAPAKVVANNVATKTSTKIIYEGEETEVIKDLRMALEGYNAGEIQLEKTELGARTGQEFYLARKSEKTYIKYTVNNSLENAVYTLLDKWGFHWYGPGTNWFVKPKSIPAADIVGAWISPTFRNRFFFGTGGLGLTMENRAFDPQNSFETNWYAWKRRNRFNEDFRAAGHSGEGFYLENKELLDAHPEWFNSEIGKQNGRIKIEVPEAVAAYKAWTKKRYASATDPFINIGVDPSDARGGADDPLPPDGFAGINNWNHADKWWWIANEVAKEYPENDKHIVVSMYAYGDGPTNALAPKFKLRKNVYPIVIPYAFQTAYMPQEMVKTWAKTIDGKMAIYDYWNITQWSQGLPQFDLKTLKDKLQFWHENKIDGIYNETTDAAGPMGHVHWLAGQLEFNLKQDFDVLYNQYLTDCFGKAAPAMKKMYDRWSNKYQGAGEISLSLDDLRAASTLVAKDSPEWKRINELKAYVHFMKLYYEHDGTQQSKDRLFEYLYSIHHLYMVQTAAFIGQDYISPLDKGNITPVGTDKRLSADEIEAQFQADLKSNPKIYSVVDFKFDYAKAKYTEPIAEASWRFGRSTNAYFVPQKSATISFDVGSENNTDFTLFTDKDGILIHQTVGKGNFDYTEAIYDRTWYMKRFEFKVKAGTTYFARIRGDFNRFKMNSDLIVYNTRGADDFDNHAYPVQYFYVPKNCEEIIFEDGSVAGPDGTIATGIFFDPKNPGEQLTGEATGIKNLYRVKVKPEWKGKVIACSFGHTLWSFKNLPNVIAMQPFEYNE